MRISKGASSRLAAVRLLAASGLALALAGSPAVAGGFGHSHGGGGGGFGGGSVGRGSFSGPGSMGFGGSGFMGFGDPSPISRGTISPRPGAFHNSNVSLHGDFHHRHPFPFRHPFFAQNMLGCCWGGWDWSGDSQWDAIDYVTAPYAPGAPAESTAPPRKDFQAHVITIPQAGQPTLGSTTNGSNTSGANSTGPATTGSATTGASTDLTGTGAGTAPTEEPATPALDPNATAGGKLTKIEPQAALAAGNVVISRPGRPDQVLQAAQ